MYSTTMGQKKPVFCSSEQPSRTFQEVGIYVSYGASGEVRTTCPRCSETRRKSQDRCLAVSIGKGVWHCHHCGWSGSLYGPREHPWQARPSAPPPPPDERKLAALHRLWDGARPISAGAPVALYLRQRGIDLDRYPSSLRYQPRLPYRHEDGSRTSHPAMLAQVVDAYGQLVSLHRTYLTHDGRKADVPQPKKLMPTVGPRAIAGAAIRLYPAGVALAVTEGIETALAVHADTGLAVWSCICAHGLASVEVPDAVVLVRIYADDDPAGLDAARALARRMLHTHRRAKLFVPPMSGMDWLDVLQAGGVA